MTTENQAANQAANQTESPKAPESTPSAAPKSGKRRKVVGAVGVLVLLGITTAYVTIGRPVAQVGTGYVAKLLGSGVFVSGRKIEDVQATDLGWFWFISSSVDKDRKTATASFLGVSQTAIYRPGRGMTLLSGADEAKLRQAAPPVIPAPGEKPWPEGSTVDLSQAPEGIDQAKLQKAVEAAFVDANPEFPAKTRAVVVCYRGQIVAERYAKGFSATTTMLGWSMTKSVTAAVAGRLVQEGKLDPSQAVKLADWQSSKDPKAKLTVDQLLRMSDGLDFREAYTGLNSDVVQMLFCRADAAGFVAEKPLAVEPDQRWSYSSGTTNLLSRVLLEASGIQGPAASLYPRRLLFNPLGLTSAIIEVDARGTPIGSSFGYMTPRDWTRFGLFILRDGVWKGERLLPEGWVEYCRTPTPKAPAGMYGAHWWLNAGDPNKPSKRWMPSLPRDVFAARGYQGQSLTIFPSLDLVVLRLGLSSNGDLYWNLEQFLKAVVDSLDEAAVKKAMEAEPASGGLAGVKMSGG